MTNWDFPAADPVDISIDSWGSGSIVVAGEPTSTIAVEVVPSHRSADVADLLAQVQVAFDDGQLSIRGPGSARSAASRDSTSRSKSRRDQAAPPRPCPPISRPSETSVP